jgi:hypothetical protein
MAGARLAAVFRTAPRSARPRPVCGADRWPSRPGWLSPPAADVTSPEPARHRPHRGRAVRQAAVTMSTGQR